MKHGFPACASEKKSLQSILFSWEYRASNYSEACCFYGFIVNEPFLKFITPLNIYSVNLLWVDIQNLCNVTENHNSR